ncbi:MAG: hypothetical protein JSS95_09435 [Acidobacteria bacterium]|nr:hypothetical protein [Acidobacteriota bacterium]
MTDMNYFRLDLKVCEGCGTLWLRRQTAVGLTTEGVYCRQCIARLVDFPAPRGRHAGGRRPRLARAAHCRQTAAPAGGAR